MKVYLMRHGKSVDAFDDRRQRPEAPLHEVGFEQAKKVGRKLVGQSFDRIYASNYMRAKQTAEMVTKELNQEFEIYEGIHEFVLPPELIGEKHDSELSGKFMEEFLQRYTDLDWKYEQKGESGRELLERAKVFAEHLKRNHVGQDILVVSHGAFMSALIAYCIFGGDYPEKHVRKFMMALDFENTGISILDHNDEKDVWKLVAHNDHSHLV